MSRPRIGINKGLPSNLYTDKNSFVYKTPDGIRKSLGTDRAKAIKTANALNIHFNSVELSVDDLINNELSARVRQLSVSELIDEFIELKKERAKSPKTLAGALTRLQQYRRALGGLSVSKVTVLTLNEWMAEYATTHDTYRHHRILLRELFSFAQASGYCPDNVADRLMMVRLARTKAKKMRKRMTQKQFDAIAKEAPPWLRVAMEIARQTGLRRSDIARLKYSDIQGDKLIIIPEKNPNFELHIKMGPKLQETIAFSRQLVPSDCPYIVHKTNRRVPEVIAKREHIGQVSPEQITRTTNRLVHADPLFVDYKPGEHPTFHEIRALCAWLYKDSGRDRDSVQGLLGHSDEEMTEDYQAGHKVEVIDTWADL